MGQFSSFSPQAIYPAKLFITTFYYYYCYFYETCPSADLFFCHILTKMPLFVFVCLLVCACDYRTSLFTQGFSLNTSSLRDLNINVTSPGETFLHNNFFFDILIQGV